MITSKHDTEQQHWCSSSTVAHLQCLCASRSLLAKQNIKCQLSTLALLYSSSPEAPELLLKEMPHILCHLQGFTMPQKAFVLSRQR